MRTTIIPFFLLLLSNAAIGQENVSPKIDRSVISIMAVPVSSTNNVLEKLEKDPGYSEAISAINSALINKGYRNTVDFKTHKEVIDKRRIMTQTTARSGDMKYYIEQASVDVLIEAEIIWTDPPGNPHNRQARVKLKAVDKYTGAVYADNAFIQSKQREFPGLPVAVNHALTEDGKEKFNQFLDQLDNSYQVLLKEGRAVNIKFEMGTKSRVTLNERIDDERLSDKLEDCIRKIALGGRYRSLGSSAEYMDFSVQVPLMDDKGAYVSPNVFLRKKVDTYFYQLGFEADCMQVNNWINFTLQQKTEPKKGTQATAPIVADSPKH